MSKKWLRRGKDPRWQAVIYLGMRGRRRYRRFYVSTLFLSAEDAARGHDRAAIAIFGPELAVTNFPLGNYGPEVIPDLRVFPSASVLPI